MDENTCVDIASRFQDPTEAAKALIQESSKRWMEKGEYMDDITAIVLFLDSPVELKLKDSTGADLEAGGLALCEQPVVDSGHVEKLDALAQFWTVFAGAASGFLGGLCGIRGPPIILYFLHPPSQVTFTKKGQRATGACITAVNVAMRIAYYLVNTLAFDEEDNFEKSDWGLYVSVAIFSVLGVLVGSQVFNYVKDSQSTIKGILATVLLLCGASLLLSSFANV
jgi:uncharacterized membrane protein YfcA